MSEDYRDALEKSIEEKDQEIERLKQQTENLRTVIKANKEYSIGYAEGEISAIESMESQIEFVSNSIEAVGEDVTAFCKLLLMIKKLMKTSTRMGGAFDIPEGTRYLQISDTLALEIASKIETVLKDHQSPLLKIVELPPSTETKEGDEENPKSGTL